MAIKKIDYSKTIIYKIVCKDLSVPDCYVGSTTQFRQRKSQHRMNCNNLNSKKYNYPLYKFIREHNGWENFEMIEIEKFPCTDGNESRACERYFFELLNAKLNTIKPFLSEEEKQNYKQKEQYKEYNKQYSKQYRQEKVKCSCNAIIARRNMSEHLKSFKHISHTRALFKPTDDEIIHA